MSMNLTITVDETQFKDILDKELKDISKEQLAEIITQAFTQYMKENPKDVKALFIQESDYYSNRVTPTPLLRTIIDEVDFTDEVKEIAGSMKKVFCEDARSLVEQLILKSMAKVFFDQFNGYGWLEEAFERMYNSQKLREQNN